MAKFTFYFFIFPQLSRGSPDEYLFIPNASSHSWQHSLVNKVKTGFSLPLEHCLIKDLLNINDLNILAFCKIIWNKELLHYIFRINIIFLTNLHYLIRIHYFLKILLLLTTKLLKNIKKRAEGRLLQRTRNKSRWST